MEVTFGNKDELILVDETTIKLIRGELSDEYIVIEINLDNNGNLCISVEDLEKLVNFYNKLKTNSNGK